MYNLNEQEHFWAHTYNESYRKKNNLFDFNLGVDAWQKMLDKAGDIQSYLECGCNIGRNLSFLDKILPDAKKSIIEISKEAFDYVTTEFQIDEKFNGPILHSYFPKNSFDLVFTMSVLIHIHPDNLIATMQKLYDYSNRYILMGEYFNRTPVMIEYQNHQDMLFKRDFGKLFIESYNVKLIDYGFFWGHLYDNAGFDDITWWLFEKQ